MIRNAFAYKEEASLTVQEEGLRAEEEQARCNTTSPSPVRLYCVAISHNLIML